MLKLSSTIHSTVQIHTPKKTGGWHKTDFPVILKILTRDQWGEKQAALIGDGDVDVDVDQKMLSVQTRVRNISETISEVLEEVVIGVPEGTKVEFDDQTVEDVDVIRQALLTNPFSSKAIFEHYANLMNGEGRRKN